MNPANLWKPSAGNGSDLDKTGVLKPSGTSEEDAILRTDAVVSNLGSQQLLIPEKVLAVTQKTSSAAPLLLIPSAYVRIDPKLIELKQSLVPQAQNSNIIMAIKREHNNNNSSSNYSDSSTFTGDDDDSSGDSFGSKMARTDVAVDYSLSSSGGYAGSGSGKQFGSKSNGPRRHTGPRKPRVSEKLTPEEEERRRVRRERNKHAAAKCRQKRVDLTNQLLAETEKLESEQAKLQADIKAFQHEKDELEFILEAHRLHCGINKSNGIANAGGNLLKLDLPDAKVAAGSLNVPTSIISATAEKVNSVAVRRPTTLNTRFATDLVTSSVSDSCQIAGITITTPSSGLNVFTLGLESMMDGHTGLTPITGLPVPLGGISTPVMITGIPGSGQLLIADSQAHLTAANETVTTPCKTETLRNESH